jgi:hypothetical protein
LAFEDIPGSNFRFAVGDGVRVSYTGDKWGKSSRMCSF